MSDVTWIARRAIAESCLTSHKPRRVANKCNKQFEFTSVNKSDIRHHLSMDSSRHSDWQRETLEHRQTVVVTSSEEGERYPSALYLYDDWPNYGATRPHMRGQRGHTFVRPNPTHKLLQKEARLWWSTTGVLEGPTSLDQAKCVIGASYTRTSDLLECQKWAIDLIKFNRISAIRSLILQQSIIVQSMQGSLSLHPSSSLSLFLSFSFSLSISLQENMTENSTLYRPMGWFEELYRYVWCAITLSS